MTFDLVNAVSQVDGSCGSWLYNLVHLPLFAIQGKPSESSVNLLSIISITWKHTNCFLFPYNFQKNRDELSTKIEELKQQVLGSKDD